MPVRPDTLAAGVVPTRTLVSVYEPDGSTFIADLDERTGLAWQEGAAGDPGEATVTVHRDDAVLAAHPTLLRKRNVIKLRYDAAKDAFYAFRIKRSTEVIVDEGEDAARVITVSGPEIRSWLDWGICKPEGGVRDESPTDRVFGWMSATGEWFDSANWIVPQGVIFGSISVRPKAGSPAGWPDPLAEWIWPTDPTLTAVVGNAYFRREFTLAVETEIIVSASFDNSGMIYVDNMQLFGADEFRTFYKTFAASVVLSAGTHTLAAQVYNRDNGGLYNPGGLILSVAEVNAAGARGTVLFRSVGAAPWLTHNTDPAPSWTRWEILRTLMLEAQARDAAGIKYLGLGFTTTTDSFGVALPDPLEGPTTIRVGDTVLQAQQQLSNLGDFDVWVDPEELVLHAAPERGLDLSSGAGMVAFSRRVNMLRWQVDEEDDVRNAPLVRFDGGWIELTEPTSVSEWGKTETMLDIGSAQDADRATLIAEAAYGVLANPQAYGQSGDQRVKPGDTPAGSMIPVPGAVPWRDFFPGDYVSAYAAGTGEPVKAWIVSMSAQEDDATGEITYDPELQDATGDFVKRPPLNVIQKYLAKTDLRFKGQDAVQPAYQTPSDYVYGGGYNTDAAPTKFASLARRPGAPGASDYHDPETLDPVYLEAVIVVGNAAVGSNLFKPGLRMPRAATLTEVTVNVETAPTGAALVFVLKLKSTGATLATVNVAAGTTSGVVSDLDTVLAKGALLRCDITQVGSSVPGSDVLVTVLAE